MKKTKRTISTLDPKVKEISSITLESVIPDLRPLMAALYLSLPDEFIRIRQLYPKGHIIHLAANTALDFHKDEKLRNLYIEDGFFAEQLEHILCVAKKNQVNGARLMPVFYHALIKADDLKLPCDLRKRIRDHMVWQRKKDGFIIAALSRERTVVIAADDVIPT